MRALFIVTFVPYPPDTGSRQRSYHLLRGLAQAAEVTLLACGSPEEIEGASPLRELCGRVELVPAASLEWVRAHGRAPLHNWPRAVLYWLHPRRPALVSWSRSAQLRTRARALAQQGFDLVFAQNLAAVDAASELGRSRMIVDLMDVEHRKLAARLRSHPASRHLPFELLEYAKLRRWERTLPQRALRVTVCSRAEALALGQQERVAVVPNAVDSSVWSDAPAVGVTASTGKIVFFGTMSYPPNSDAAIYFAESIFPMVRLRAPGAELAIVGHSPPRSVQGLSRLAGVTITGPVADLRPVLDSATIAVAPLRYGGGTRIKVPRIKVLEALARGVPVVAKPLAIDGLDLEPGRHLLVAEGAERLAGPCVRLLGDADLRRTLATEGARVVRERYDWRRVEHQVADLARNAAEESANHASSTGA